MYQKFATLSDTWTFLWTAWHIINNYKIYQTVNRLRSLLSLHVIMSSCRQTGTSQRRCHQARHWLFSIYDLWSMITQFFNLWSMYCGDSLKFSLYNLTLIFLCKTISALQSIFDIWLMQMRQIDMFNLRAKNMDWKVLDNITTYRFASQTTNDSQFNNNKVTPVYWINFEAIKNMVTAVL